MPGFTKEQARAARQADLSAFLLRNDPGHYVREGKSLRLIDPSRPKRDRRKSISIKIGTNWWHDFATGETGNCVEYLTKRMGYSLVDAILALSDGAYVPAPSLSASAGFANADLQEEKRLEFPEAAKGSSLPMYDYLSGRGIPAWMIRHLEGQKLLYLSGRYNNLVFINRERDFAEIRGTWRYGPAFHQVMKSRPDRFWAFSSVKDPDRAFVCESAIDAVSLYLLHRAVGESPGASYISLAGVANQRTIDRIKKLYPSTVIAVDRDEAGEACRKRNPECSFLISDNKDWNEDLVKKNIPVTHRSEVRERNMARDDPER